MELFRGTTVTVRTRAEAGEDAMGDPIVEWSEEEVGNVLAMPATAAAQGDITPHRSETTMTFSFPKTWNKDLREAEITYSGRTFKVLENPAPIPAALCPTAWNYSVEAVRVDG